MVSGFCLLPRGKFGIAKFFAKRRFFAVHLQIRYLFFLVRASEEGNQQFRSIREVAKRKMGLLTQEMEKDENGESIRNGNNDGNLRLDTSGDTNGRKPVCITLLFSCFYVELLPQWVSRNL